ncbi:MAG TPA: hypothetical protein VNR18_10580 [Hyphomicrobiales bacterium]|nr:hypothetical protein [Hyphomicrobiales bacterium]
MLLDAVLLIVIPLFFGFLFYLLIVLRGGAEAILIVAGDRSIVHISTHRKVNFRLSVDIFAIRKKSLRQAYKTEPNGIDRGMIDPEPCRFGQYAAPEKMEAQERVRAAGWR